MLGTCQALARVATGALALDPTRGLWAEETARRVLAARDGKVPEGVVSMHQAMALREGGWKPYDLHGSVAVIPVLGLILPDFDWLGCRWATGCMQLRWQIGEALADDDVAAIALWVDSPGGYVAGVDQTATTIRAAREAKPVASVIANMAFSAAYWLASSADTISVSRDGGLGHIGVIGLHLDFTGLFEAEGVVPTLFYSGARKADGHPLKPVEPDYASAVQAEIDDLRRLFAQSVADGRRDALTLDAVLATEAQAFSGPAALARAEALGLFDAVLPADDALALFVEGITQAGTAG
ncbi:MAG: S49 family peptidase [Pseudomonadota bacterium]